MDTTMDTASVHPKILCCLCGVGIDWNASNLCVSCLRTQVDITEQIPKQCVLLFCRFCERYLNPPNDWQVCALESRELLSLCLKRLKNLSKVHLVDASFIWTEPHSKRIKVKLTVQDEVHNVVLQQSFAVEYVVQYQMCDQCRRIEAKDTWNASVQVRQKTKEKRTLFYLEQLLIKYDGTRDCSGIKLHHDGLDFFFSHESGARRLVELLQALIPIRNQHSKRLVSHDASSNIYNYKYTSSVEVVPLCRDNVVCLPPKVARSMSNIGQICVVVKVTNLVHFVDPNTCQVVTMSASNFFKAPFTNLATSKQLVEYTVINVEPMRQDEQRRVAGQGTVSRKHVLADCWVMKTSELGMTDDSIHCRTHLGHLLQPGDSVMGFDLRNSNVNNAWLEDMKPESIPDVVLVKKVYGDKSVRNRRRKFKLKHIDDLANAMDTGSTNQDYTAFLEDLEEDLDLRANVNVYKDTKKASMAVDEEDMEEHDTPRITLAEMLDELDIDNDNMDGNGMNE